MKPFIKWVGGKRWLVANRDFNFPTFTGRYVEPFLGGGAVFFHLQPKQSILADLNPKLIETYQAIRDDWRRCESELYRLQKLHSKEFYYEERSRVRRTPHTRAAQFLYLNRTCWNGLYRENLKGQFNVPIGTKDRVIFEDESFEKISEALGSVEIYCKDFEDTISMAVAGDLVFADPPYTTAHNLNGFVKYNQNIFSWADQIRLKESLMEAVNRGVKVVMTNADHESIHNLYDGLGVYASLNRASVVAGNSNYRSVTSEAVYVFG
ncbi:DNA adenine methylase [Pararhodobacter oceanensis]|uniref:DNA adenine methylase n=1 Tax=Pararhodobacter oceanensis TaxID=2172121 RepID=UPI0019825DEA|nr:Dam family site-specific DNA-(adenine-N6)-methyltransferase [Pararhodobacter oceanensis]